MHFTPNLTLFSPGWLIVEIDVVVCILRACFCWQSRQPSAHSYTLSLKAVVCDFRSLLLVLSFLQLCDHRRCYFICILPSSLTALVEQHYPTTEGRLCVFRRNTSVYPIKLLSAQFFSSKIHL